MKLVLIKNTHYNMTFVTCSDFARSCSALAKCQLTFANGALDLSPPNKQPKQPAASPSFCTEPDLPVLFSLFISCNYLAFNSNCNYQHCSFPSASAPTTALHVSIIHTCVSVCVLRVCVCGGEKNVRFQFFICSDFIIEAGGVSG